MACSYSADTIIVSSDSPWPGLNRYSHDGGATVHDATGIAAETIPVILPNGDVYAATAGNQIYKSTDGGKSYTMVALNVGHLSRGIYLIKVSTRTRNGVGRISLY